MSEGWFTQTCWFIALYHGVNPLLCSNWSCHLIPHEDGPLCSLILAQQLDCKSDGGVWGMTEGLWRTEWRGWGSVCGFMKGEMYRNDEVFEGLWKKGWSYATRCRKVHWDKDLLRFMAKCISSQLIFLSSLFPLFFHFLNLFFFVSFFLIFSFFAFELSELIKVIHYFWTFEVILVWGDWRDNGNETPAAVGGCLIGFWY